jgi:hypothetical protein
LRYIVLVLLAASALAQTSAGGKWTLSVMTDKMTDAKTEQFSLAADAEIEDIGIRSLPTLNLLCSGNGHFYIAPLRTGVVLSTSGLSGDHLYQLRVRTDSKYTTMFWDRAADEKTVALSGGGVMGKHWLKKVLNAKDVRVEIPTFSGYLLVAQFSPAGLNREMLARSCGLK